MHNAPGCTLNSFVNIPCMINELPFSGRCKSDWGDDVEAEEHIVFLLNKAFDAWYGVGPRTRIDWT